MKADDIAIPQSDSLIYVIDKVLYVKHYFSLISLATFIQSYRFFLIQVGQTPGIGLMGTFLD
jgi:hypothetical protein